VTREQAQERDAADPLREFRERFAIDDELVYLDGNSLGRLPRATVDRLAQIVSEQWGGRLIRGWDEGWMELPLTIGDRLGAAALGAAAGQVAIADSTTVCFYKLASAALELRPGRDQIVTDYDNFPTDRYVLAGLARARGLELVFLRGDPSGGPEP
jgi:kynureninase